MKYFSFILMAAISISKSYSQKIEGIYFGKIFTVKNALVIENKRNNEISGHIYLNESEKIFFSGTYLGTLAKLKTQTESGKEVLLDARFEREKLVLTNPDSVNNHNRILYKISSKKNINIKILFLNKWDSRLFGKWESFKRLDDKGKIYDNLGKVAYYFGINGQGYYTIITLPKGDNFPLDTKLNKRDIKWSIFQGKLSVAISGYTPNESSVDFTVDYLINNDTLRMGTPYEYITYYLRK